MRAGDGGSESVHWAQSKSSTLFHEHGALEGECHLQRHRLAASQELGERRRERRLGLRPFVQVFDHPGYLRQPKRKGVEIIRGIGWTTHGGIVVLHLLLLRRHAMI